MGLIKEVKTFGFEVFSEEPIVHCKDFEDNSGAIEITCLPKIRPHTKSINIVFQNFREYACKGLVHTHQVSTDDQHADTWNKRVRNVQASDLATIFLW